MVYAIFGRREGENRIEKGLKEDIHVKTEVGKIVVHFWASIASKLCLSWGRRPS